ncbi:Gfo/Idh/MocA family protein [Paenibacillus ginsengihumi]|uniref:Gfo/Idh/MocA family protein n=1 Tax=Paenibacillus ginsengihumi TaxID=431596 RepID=UPI000376C74A|nr:Gfo/Idh/MocA family oxidoreductase [Paenibacillus ginsengihumi]
MSKLKVGMISFAHQHAVGYFHLLRRHPDVEIVGIADGVKERVQRYVEESGVPYFERYENLLATDADAVVVCSENKHHAEHTIRAARAGKHVLCEKPLGLSREEMERMIAACEEHGVQLMTAFPCRYLPAVVEAKKAVERGEIGRIVAIKGTNRGTMPGKWFVDPELAGGGAVLDHTVHVMDLMHWFTGSRAAQVFAHAETLFHPIPTDDAGMVHVTFENGVFGVLDPSWSRPKSFPTWGDVTMSVIGTDGVIHIDGLASRNEVYSDERDKAVWSYYGDSMDEWMIDDFVAAILGRKPVPITGRDGMQSALVALAAYESAKAKAPVDLK